MYNNAYNAGSGMHVNTSLPYSSQDSFLYNKRVESSKYCKVTEPVKVMGMLRKEHDFSQAAPSSHAVSFPRSVDTPREPRTVRFLDSLETNDQERLYLYQTTGVLPHVTSSFPSCSPQTHFLQKMSPKVDTPHSMVSNTTIFQMDQLARTQTSLCEGLLSIDPKKLPTSTEEKELIDLLTIGHNADSKRFHIFWGKLAFYNAVTNEGVIMFRVKHQSTYQYSAAFHYNDVENSEAFNIKNGFKRVESHELKTNDVLKFQLHYNTLDPKLRVLQAFNINTNYSAPNQW